MIKNQDAITLIITNDSEFELLLSLKCYILESGVTKDSYDNWYKYVIETFKHSNGVIVYLNNWNSSTSGLGFNYPESPTRKGWVLGITEQYNFIVSILMKQTLNKIKREIGLE